MARLPHYWVLGWDEFLEWAERSGVDTSADDTEDNEEGDWQAWWECWQEAYKLGHDAARRGRG